MSKMRDLIGFRHFVQLKWCNSILRFFQIAFSFRYSHLSHAYRETYVARNSSNKCALVKPGDRMLTSYSYIGFSNYNRGAITEYVKSGFFGESRGNINLETGQEL